MLLRPLNYMTARLPPLPPAQKGDDVAGLLITYNRFRSLQPYLPSSLIKYSGICVVKVSRSPVTGCVKVRDWAWSASH